MHPDELTATHQREEGVMADEAHTDDCQGCVADRLTEADRAYLRSRGWTHPPHTYRIPPEMPPRPVRRHAPARSLMTYWTAVYWGYCGPAAFVDYLPFDPLLVYGIGSAVLATWLTISNAHHHRRHPHLNRPGCRWCSRQAARIWADYDGMKDRQNRRAHYMEYRRLQERERRYREDPPE